MQRRGFLKGALAITASPGILTAQTASTTLPAATVTPGPLPWMQGLDHANFSSVRTLDLEDAVEAELQFFGPVQMESMRRLSAVLLPPLKGYPGATEAKTPEFLDFFLSKASHEMKSLFQEGLDRLDVQARGKYGMAFADLSPTQVDGIIKPLMVTWMADNYPPQANIHFMSTAHHYIRSATRNSPAWARAAGTHGKHPVQSELYWLPVEPMLG